MPTYQYRCTKCGHEFEEFQSITESPLSFCKKCNGRVERLISGGAGLLFKGSGFYITDYRSDSYKKAAKKEAPGAAEKTSKTESKPSSDASGSKNSSS